MKTARRCAVATFPKLWPPYATPRLACFGGQAIRTLQQHAVGWLPSRYRRWRSSGLKWKTKWPWLNGLLLDIGQQIDHHLPTALHHPKDGRSFLLQGASTRFALESASTTLPALALDHLWVSFMASNHVGFIAFHLVGERHRGLFFTIPSRSSAVI